MVVTPFHGGTLAHAAVANPSAITSALVAELGLAEPDDEEVGAVGTWHATRKALPGEGKTGSIHPVIHDIDISFFALRIAPRGAFLLGHG
jgi:hypothetical protein